MSAPAVLPAPRFADVKFNQIGRQPELLGRFSAPDPNIPFQYHSPSPTPDLELKQAGSDVKPPLLLRRTLLEALAEDAEAGDATMVNATDEMLVDDEQHHPPLLNFPTSDGAAQSHKTQLPASPKAPFTEQKTVGTEHSAVSPVQPTSQPSVPPSTNLSMSSSQHISPYVPTPSGKSGVDLLLAPPSQSPDRSPSPYHDSILLRYPSSRPSECPETTRRTIPIEEPPTVANPSKSQTHPTSQNRSCSPEIESPFTTLRSLQVRLMSSLSTLSTPPTTSAAQAQAHLLVQSAHTSSAAALAMAHRAHTLAEQAFVTAQESLAAARECLNAADKAKTQAGDAMNAIENISGENEVTPWEWKEIVSGLKGDLEALEVWVGEREGEEALGRREKEKKDQEEKNREVVERTMGSRIGQGDGKGLSDGTLRAMSAEVEQRSGELRVRQTKKQTIDQSQDEDAEGDIRMGEGQEDGDDREKRAAEVEADLARRAWDSERELSAEQALRRRPQQLDGDEITTPVEQDQVGLASERANAAAAAANALAEEARVREQEEHAQGQKEIEILLQAEKDLKERELQEELQLEQKKREQLVKEQEELRLRVLQAEEKEKEARLIKEQETKRKQVMEQKQRASAEAAVKIIAEREAKERQISRNLAATSTTTPATPAGNVAGPSTSQATKPQARAPAEQVGNVVSRKTALPMTSPQNQPTQETIKEKSRVLSGGIKLGVEEKSPITRPLSPLFRAAALGLRPGKTALASGSSTAPLTTPTPSAAVTAHTPTTTGGHSSAAVVPEVQTVAPSDQIFRLNPNLLNPEKNKASQGAGGDPGPKKPAKAQMAEILATVRQHQSQNPTALPLSVETPHGAMGYSRGLQGVAGADLIARNPIPPSTHLITPPSPLPSSPLPAAFARASIYRQSRDAGNLPVTPLSLSSALSPEAHMLNLRHIMEAKGIDWERKYKVEPESPVQVKAELGDEDGPLLSPSPSKLHPSSKSQKPTVARPTASSNAIPTSAPQSQTAPVSSTAHGAPPNLLPPRPQKPKLPKFSKAKDPHPGQQHSPTTPEISPSWIDSRPIPPAKAPPSTHLEHIERYPPSRGQDDLAQTVANPSNGIPGGTLGFHDQAAQGDGGWRLQNGNEISTNHIDASNRAPYEPSAGGGRRRRPYDHYSPDPDSHRYGYHYMPPEISPLTGHYVMPTLRQNEYATPSGAIPARSLSPPRYITSRKRSRESNHTELPPSRRRRPSAIENQPDQWVSARSLSPQPMSAEGQRRHGRVTPPEKPALENRIERSRSPDDAIRMRGDSYRPSYDQVPRSPDYPHSSVLPATSVAQFEQDGQQDERPGLLDRLSSGCQPGTRGTSYSTSRPPRGSSKPRGGGRGAPRGALPQRAPTLIDRLA